MFIAIVPAYNEEKNIGSVVRSLFSHVDQVVVVDDCSSDRTVEEAKVAGATVLVHTINRGQGAALETGHEYARSVRAEYIIHFDGDGQFSVDDIRPAFDHLQKHNADVLLGSRFLDGRSNVPFFKKYILHPAAKIINRAFGGLYLSDVHNGFRILSRRALEYIKINQDRMAHATEIPHLVRKHNLRYVEFPVKVIYKKYGQSGLSGIDIIKDLFFGKFIK